MQTTPTEPSEWLAWYERLSAAGFGFVLFLAGVGSYFGIWLWGPFYRERVAELAKQHEERVAELNARIAQLEASEARWQDMALGMLPQLEKVAATRLSSSVRQPR